MREEEGSISILVLSLFLLVLTLSMAILDVSANFLAKQELTHIGEVAISTASHSIDLDRYYRADRIFVKNGAKGPIYRVPIDCSTALTKFEREISTQSLRGRSIYLASWNCYRDSLSAQLESYVPLVVPIPFASSNSFSQSPNSFSQSPNSFSQSPNSSSHLSTNSLGQGDSGANTAHILATVKAESIVVGSG